MRPARRYAVERAPDSAPAYIRLRAGGVSGAFLIDYGSTRSTLSAAAFVTATGSVHVEDFSLHSFRRGSFALRRYHFLRQPQGGQIGVVGTDFLSRLTVRFSGDEIIMAAAPADSAALAALGLTPIAQRGFFSSDLARVERGRPNVPVVFLRIGALGAFAQIDTGYDDHLRPHSVDVNEAFFQQLAAGGAALDHVEDIWVATCNGRERRPVFLVRGQPLIIESETGAPLFAIEDYRVIVKRPNGCGGVATMRVPAAQLGASFLSTFGATVFDPRSERIWIGRPGGAARSG